MIRRPLPHHEDRRRLSPAQPPHPAMAQVLTAARNPILPDTVTLTLDSGIIVRALPSITAQSPTGVPLQVTDLSYSSPATRISLTFNANVSSDFPLRVHPMDPAIRTRSGGWLTPGIFPLTGATILVRDTFTDANGTPLTAHTPEIGGPWLQRQGTQEIQSNRCVGASAGTHNIAGINTGQADVVITAIYRATVAGGITVDANAGIMLRMVNAAANWIVFLNSQGVIINLIEDFTFDRGSFGFIPLANTDYELAVKAIGESITVYLDRVQIIQYSAAANHVLVTQHGLDNFGDTAENSWNDLTIRYP